MNSIAPGARQSSRALFKRRRLNPPSAHASPQTRRRYSAPTFAPKPILDIKHIAQNPGLYSQNALDRNYPAQADAPWRITELRDANNKLKRAAADDRAKINAVEREIAKLKSAKHDKDDAAAAQRIETLISDAAAIRARLTASDATERANDAHILALALSLPNLSSSFTPVGSTPHALHEDTPSAALRQQTKSHVDIGAELDLLDFAASATTSGWGWYFLRNEAAQLEQALVAFALAELRARAWTQLAVPSLVYEHIAAACGFQPRDQHGEAQIYTLASSSGNDAAPRLVLTGTAEIPLAGMHAGATLPAASLPLRTAAVSRCYRAEAGARGVDTKGLYRVHEFTKVEMFAWTAPEDDDADAGDTHHFASARPPEKNQTGTQASLLAEMVSLQTHILTSLGLTLRTLEMPSHDLGASAARKIDIEAFFPSRQQHQRGGGGGGSGWGELSSASACAAYQSRRLGARVRMPDGRLAFPGTLNGTALAVPRVLAALLETGFERGRVRVPECLGAYMGGLEWIEARKKT